MGKAMNVPNKEKQERVEIDARDMYYKQLNQTINSFLNNGAHTVELININGQRYIANGISKQARIVMRGTPGNNLASFLNGAEIVVFGNAQEQVANTMNSGKVVIHGHASDVLGYGMRGGKVFVKGDVGYRVGIHMKEYRNLVPAIVVGETTGDFLGEYMAGGVLLVLGLNCDNPEDIVGDWTGTGMHGGMIITRGVPIPEHKLGREPALVDTTERDMKIVHELVTEFSSDFNLDAKQILEAPFYKYVPLTHRPYGKLYVNQP